MLRHDHTLDPTPLRSGAVSASHRHPSKFIPSPRPAPRHQRLFRSTSGRLSRLRRRPAALPEDLKPAVHRRCGHLPDTGRCHRSETVQDCGDFCSMRLATGSARSKLVVSSSRSVSKSSGRLSLIVGHHTRGTRSVESRSGRWFERVEHRTRGRISCCTSDFG